ncbi:acyltransferase [Sphingomonas sp. RHCKR47]|uniref:acyltransferase family protein n=1 Tax=Sphingomonas citricola TaxID=2862498 RepID=UPI001C67B200|nr:acyltransferase [Sphingomonas citricola]MBW6524005.1 acyltransferase [Sphingomonas citricola]
MTAAAARSDVSIAARLRARLARRSDDLSRDQIVPLQFLRGIAASGVVVQHLLERYARRGALPGAIPDFTTRFGQVGVATFFAISGFIMVYIALRDSQRVPTGRAFLRHRFLRVAPLYYLTTLLIIAFGLLTQQLASASRRQPTVMEVIYSFAFIPHRGANGVIQPVYELGWTLHYEMFFYLLFAAGLALLRRHGAALVLTTLVLLIVAGVGRDAPPDRASFALAAYVFTRPIMAYFAIGIAIAFLRHRVSTHLPAVPASLIIALAVVAFVTATTSDRRFVAMPAIAIALACTVLLRPRREDHAGRLNRFSRAFGDASYSIYLTHSFLLGAFAWTTARFAAQSFAGLAFLAVIACEGCFVAGWLTWRFVELPVTRKLQRRRPALETVAP